MAIKSFPQYASDLLKDLQEQFPPRCIERDESIEDHQRYAGKVELITYIRDWESAANKAKS